MRVTVLLTVLSTVDTDCLFADEFAAVVVTLLAVVLPLETADGLTLLAEEDCADAALPTLLALATPPLVEVLLVNTRSEPVCLRSPCHLSSWCTGMAG